MLKILALAALVATAAPAADQFTVAVGGTFIGFGPRASYDQTRRMGLGVTADALVERGNFQVGVTSLLGLVAAPGQVLGITGLAFLGARGAWILGDGTFAPYLAASVGGLALGYADAAPAVIPEAGLLLFRDRRWFRPAIALRALIAPRGDGANPSSPFIDAGLRLYF